MQWSNLYSTASKYNLCIKQSRYQYLLLLSGCIFFSLLLVSYLTYAYQLVLVTAVLTITALSILITKQRNGQLTTLQIILDEQGICSFKDILGGAVESTDEMKEEFQLLSSSRYSFFGCWLHMTPLSNMYPPKSLLYATNERSEKKRLFIYRDSLSSKDFSRLSQVIRKLKETS